MPPGLHISKRPRPISPITSDTRLYYRWFTPESGVLPTGAATVLSGPAVDGQSWQSRGLFVL